MVPASRKSLSIWPVMLYLTDVSALWFSHSGSINSARDVVALQVGVLVTQKLI